MEQQPTWDIRAKGRAWASGEGMDRYALAPEKIEMVKGKLFWSERERLNMLGLLLENVGAEKAVTLGDSSVWIAAVARLSPPPE